jgi:hypothetical protein
MAVVLIPRLARAEPFSAKSAVDVGRRRQSPCKSAKSLTDGAGFAFRRHQELRSFDRLDSFLQAQQSQQFPF